MRTKGRNVGPPYKVQKTELLLITRLFPQQVASSLGCNFKEAVATRLEAVASRLEAIAARVEAIASRLEGIAARVGAIAKGTPEAETGCEKCVGKSQGGGDTTTCGRVFPETPWPNSF